MDRDEALKIMTMVNFHHFEANPEPPDEETLAYHRQERDTRIKMLKDAGYTVELQRRDSLESCGRYFLGEKRYPMLQEDRLRYLCPTCGKLHHYINICADDTEASKLVYALHKHIDWCTCGAPATKRETHVSAK